MKASLQVGCGDPLYRSVSKKYFALGHESWKCGCTVLIKEGQICIDFVANICAKKSLLAAVNAHRLQWH